MARVDAGRLALNQLCSVRVEQAFRIGVDMTDFGRLEHIHSALADSQVLRHVFLDVEDLLLDLVFLEAAALI